MHFPLLQVRRYPEGDKEALVDWWEGVDQLALAGFWLRVRAEVNSSKQLIAEACKELTGPFVGGVMKEFENRVVKNPENTLLKVLQGIPEPKPAPSAASSAGAASAASAAVAVSQPPPPRAG